MKQIAMTLVLLSMFLFSFVNVSVKKTCKYEDGKIKCSYETNEGRFEGQYTSYYKNGQKKAEGKFEHNCRVGTWKVWDSLGTIQAERIYENPLSIKRIIPAVTKESPETVKFPLIYNGEGFIDMFKLEESYIVWTKKMWRFIPVENNDELFKGDRLYNIIQKNVENKNVAIYSTVDDEFTTPVSFVDISPAYKHMIGYRLKEVLFYDNQRQVCESRIIGICPMLTSDTKKDTLAAYWIYYPLIRKILAQEKVAGSGIPVEVKTLDDVFFLRYFNSVIEKEYSCVNKYTDANSEKTEIRIIECEHDLWMMNSDLNQLINGIKKP